MERCAYCGDKVGDDALYVDDEIFCSEDCMRDFGAGESYDEEDDEDDDEESGSGAAGGAGYEEAEDDY